LVKIYFQSKDYELRLRGGFRGFKTRTGDKNYKKGMAGVQTYVAWNPKFTQSVLHAIPGVSKGMAGRVAALVTPVCRVYFQRKDKEINFHYSATPALQTESWVPDTYPRGLEGVKTYLNKNPEAVAMLSKLLIDGRQDRFKEAAKLAEALGNFAGSGIQLRTIKMADYPELKALSYKPKEKYSTPVLFLEPVPTGTKARPEYKDNYKIENLKVVGIWPNWRNPEINQVIGKATPIMRIPMRKVGYVDPRNSKKLAYKNGFQCDIDMNLEYSFCAGCCCRTTNADGTSTRSLLKFKAWASAAPGRDSIASPCGKNGKRMVRMESVQNPLDPKDMRCPQFCEWDKKRGMLPAMLRER